MRLVCKSLAHLRAAIISSVQHQSLPGMLCQSIPQQTLMLGML